MSNTDRNDISLTGGEALSSRWCDEDDMAHIEDSMRSGDFASETPSTIEVCQFSNWVEWWERLHMMLPLAHPDCVETNYKTFVRCGYEWDRVTYLAHCYPMVPSDPTTKRQICCVCKQPFVK